MSRLITGLAAGLGVASGICLAAATPAQATCEFFSEPQRFNTQMDGAVIVVGQQPQQSYRVVIPGDDVTTLTALRTCVLDAFVARTRFGPHIQVGSFANRRDAETIRRILQKEGYRPRVLYVR
ncbi:MAG: SPOR domain-containing protein [Phormidesmis sp.]